MPVTQGQRREYQRRWYLRNADIERAKARQRATARSPEKHRAAARKARAKLRDKVLDHYGRACACCGSVERLTVDHVNGDGRQHREELFGRNDCSSTAVYRWLISNGFPPDFQILCLPCNISKRNGSACRIDHRKAA